MNNFEYCSQKITIQKDAKEKQITAEIYILRMLMSILYKTKAAVNLEASLVHPLANHPPALFVSGVAPRKCVKSKLYNAALKDLYLTDRKQLPGKETLHKYFLDVIALMRLMPLNNGTLRDFVWRILKSIAQQYSTLFLACDSYKDNSIKNVEAIGQGYVLKIPLKISRYDNAITIFSIY